MLPPEDLDTLLTLQLAVAYAGEQSSDHPRLGWWSTDMVREFGGLDFFARLTPRTAQWSALEVAREAARRTDAASRRRDANPDRLRSLFSLGFELDEQLADRLAHHKRSGKTPAEALPELADLLTEWNPDAFAAWAKRGTDLLVDKVTDGFRGHAGLVPRHFIREFINKMELGDDDGTPLPVEQVW
jgi:hypothetical protein